MKGGDRRMEGEHYTTAEAAQRLHISKETLARKLSKGKLVGVKVGRQWLIKKETLDALLQPSTPQGT
jgi:excisionase family DNA binding protein